MLRTARDVYGEHYDDLTSIRKTRIMELAALADLERLAMETR